MHLEEIAMLHGYMCNHVHPNPCGTNRAYPVLGLRRVHLVDVAAEPDDVEVVPAEGAGELCCPRLVVPAASGVLEAQIQIVSRLEGGLVALGESRPRIGLHEDLGRD